MNLPEINPFSDNINAISANSSRIGLGLIIPSSKRTLSIGVHRSARKLEAYT